MPKRRDVLKGTPRENNDQGRRIKIEAWKNFVEFRNKEMHMSAEHKAEAMEALEIYLNKTIDNINFSFRDIRRKNFICKKAVYAFFGNEIDCWLIRLNITNEVFGNMSFFLSRAMNIQVDIYMGPEAFYYSEWKELTSEQKKMAGE
jgi:hypothetical protein